MAEELYKKIERILISFSKEEKIIFMKQLQRNINLTNCSNTAERLYKFIKSNKNLKLTEACVPKTVLPQNVKGSLYDVRIKSRGPDDKIYGSNKDIREMITRGLTFLTLNCNNKSLPLDLVVYANKKFSGGTGDDDDFLPENEDSWKKFFLEEPDKSCQIVSCTKLNGEAGHFSGRFIGDEFYYFIGSKNVHMMLKSIDEICLYSDQRYSIARVVATAVLMAIRKLKPDNRSILESFLDKTKVTFVCEVLQPEFQHIVNLCYLEEPVVEVVTVTSTANENDSLTAFSPHLILKFGQLMGFTTTKYEIRDLDNLQDEILKIRQLENVEGNVIYFLNIENKTIGLCKVKTYWYVLLRALREKAVRGFTSRNTSVGDIVKETKARFKVIQSWLKFEDSLLLQWQDTAEIFLKWIERQIKLKKYEAKEIRPKYPIIWMKFLNREN